MHTVVVNKESIEAMVYIMNKKYKVGFPSADYFDVIRKGYNDNGLSIEYLEKSLIESSELVNTQGEWVGYRRVLRDGITSRKYNLLRYSVIFQVQS